MAYAHTMTLKTFERLTVKR